MASADTSDLLTLHTKAGISVPQRDPLYLFACRTLALREHNLEAAQEIISALDDDRPPIRAIAGSFLHEFSQEFSTTSVQGEYK